MQFSSQPKLIKIVLNFTTDIKKQHGKIKYCKILELKKKLKSNLVSNIHFSND